MFLRKTLQTLVNTTCTVFCLKQITEKKKHATNLIIWNELIYVPKIIVKLPIAKVYVMYINKACHLEKQNSVAIHSYQEHTYKLQRTMSLSQQWSSTTSQGSRDSDDTHNKMTGLLPPNDRDRT